MLAQMYIIIILSSMCNIRVLKLERISVCLALIMSIDSCRSRCQHKWTFGDLICTIQFQDPTVILPSSTLPSPQSMHAMANDEIDDLAFRYRVLPDPATHVRVLHLHPSSSEFDLVSCSFEDLDLTSHTASFVAHEPVDDHDAPRDYALVCDDIILEVSEETHFTLRNLRNQPDERLRRVWSPRICINHADENEQSLQLKCVPRVYEQALQRISMTPSYKHEPLSGPDCIRVIEMDFSAPPATNVLRTRMRQISLADKPTFFYLDVREGLASNTWPDKTPILCNRRLLNLPTPLANILSVVLRSKGPRAFWVPAICQDKDTALEPATDQLVRARAKEVVGIRQPVYTYQPLPQGRPHIRLLKIVPATASDDVLVADIGHFSLDDSCPPFVALSYVWGPPNPPWMVCTRDGRYIVCTQSLRLALCHLRDRGELIVWADAICINQNDYQEKSKQVLLMGEIYKRASRVVVELGMTCANDKHLVCRDYLRALLNMLSLTARTLAAVRPDEKGLHPREYGKFGIPSYGHQAWGAWRAMRSTSWFTRSWIVQEVTAGRNVTLLYNGQSFRWADIYLANGVTAREQVDLKTYNGKMNIQNMGDLQNTDKSDLPKLLDLLSIFRTLNATDPRDKIYAFRGLASDENESPLPDYAKSVEQVFVDFAAFFVRRGLTGQLLLEAGRNRTVRNVPSWVPDWSNNESWQIYSYAKQSAWLSLNSLRQRSAEKKSPVTTTVGVVEAGQLKTRACFVDDIDALSSAVSNTFVYENASERPRINREVLDLYNSAQEIATGLTNDKFSAESIRAGAQRTLLGGTDKSFNPLYAFYERSKIMGTIQDDGEKDSIAAFDETLRERLSNRRFCITKQGRMGIVPSISIAGDTVGFVEHIMSPFVFRDEGEGQHTLVGDAFFLDSSASRDEEAYTKERDFIEISIV